MVQVWYPSRLLRINSPSWSLCCEIFFYLFFPLLGVWLWRLRGTSLWMTALVLYVAGQALVWELRPHFGAGRVLAFPLLHLSTFALGILLARWQSLQRERETKAAVPAWRVYAVLGVSTAALAFSIRLQPLFHVPSPYNNGALAPLFAGFIWALSATSTPLSRWLCARWLVALGNSSYALYLIHHPIVDLFRRLQWVSLIFYPIYVALCIGLSLLSFHFFETPIRLWLVERFQTRRDSEASAHVNAKAQLL
jgi:peptidoglycan/LPS O-acetylase OafA/YrhL